MRGMELSWSQILDLATDELEQIMNELEKEVYARMTDLTENNMVNAPAYVNYGATTGIEFEQTTQADMGLRESYLIRISMARQFLSDSTSTVAGAKQWQKEQGVSEKTHLSMQAHAILSEFYEGEVYRDSDLWRAIDTANKGDLTLEELLDRAAALFESKYPQFTHHWTPSQGKFYEVN